MRWICLLSLLIAVPVRGAEPPRVDRPNYASVLVEGVPHVQQKPDFCGEACAAMYLAKLGVAMDQDFVFDQSGLDPLRGRGCYTRELTTALRRIGFQTGDVWHRISAADAERQLETMFRALHADLVAGVPSILCMRYDDRGDASEHFRLVLGYDARTDEIIYHEPALRQGANQRMRRDVLFQLWPLKYDARQWTIVRLRLKPGQLMEGRTATRLTDADYAQHIRRLKEQLLGLRERHTELAKQRDAELQEEQRQEQEAREAGQPYEPQKLSPRIVSDFQIVIEKPFVVIGDESLAQIRRHAQGTIHWAVERLKQDYFHQDPDHVINIWLFRDKTSYEQNVVDIFRSRPHTPFGYYSPAHKALVMNIDTGGGTLVHEIVHPFMAANFPECPSWFNEGLGSLYEQSRDQNGRIWGLTNWRLRGLQGALDDETYTMPTFQQLCGTSTREFYNEDPGTNYAQARYLLYYLQQKGLLVKYYHEFRDNARDDPTGYQTLQRVLGEEDMEKFQETWSEFVRQLRF